MTKKLIKKVSPKQLIGKTIKNAFYRFVSDEYDDRPFLVLIMNDDTRFMIESQYDNEYTGKSADEYRKYINTYKIK